MSKSKSGSGSILPNGKPGMFGEDAIDFDLRNLDLAEKVCLESKKKNEQIISLYKSAPKVFLRSSNEVWDMIINISASLKIPLSEKLLCLMHDVEGMKLSFDSYLMYTGNQKRCSRHFFLAQSLNTYVEYQYRFHIEESCSEQDLELALNMFLNGAALMTANFEPLISAGKSRTSDASKESNRLFEERKDKCLNCRDKILARNSRLSNAAIANLIHKELGKDLGVSVKTIQGYFKGL